MFTMNFLLVFVVALLSQANCHPDGNRQLTEQSVSGKTHNYIPIETAPYSAAIYKFDHWNDKKYSCGATIIHEQFLLTAADCCRDPKEKRRILVGFREFNEANGYNGNLRDIERIIVHEKYNILDSDYNVCLIKMYTKLPFGSKIGKIGLPEEGFNIPAGATLNATGWERIFNPLQTLFQDELPFVNKKTCEKIWDDRTYHTELSPRDICAGGRGYLHPVDAGNSLTLGDIQVGIGTRHYGYGSMPGIYTRVASVVNWIDKTIEKYQ